METAKSKDVFLNMSSATTFQKTARPSTGTKMVSAPATCMFFILSMSGPKYMEHIYQCAKCRASQPLYVSTDPIHLPKHTQPEVTIPPERQISNPSHWEELLAVPAVAQKSIFVCCCTSA